MKVIQTTPYSDATTGSSKPRSASAKEDQESRPLDAQLRAPPKSPLRASSEPVIRLGQLKELFEAVLEKQSQSTSDGPESRTAGPEQSGEEDQDKDFKPRASVLGV